MWGCECLNIPEKYIFRRGVFGRHFRRDDNVLWRNLRNLSLFNFFIYIPLRKLLAMSILFHYFKSSHQFELTFYVMLVLYCILSEAFACHFLLSFLIEVISRIFIELLPKRCKLCVTSQKRSHVDIKNSQWAKR